MKIAVIGAGAIGSVLGGLLIDSVLGAMRLHVNVQERLDFKPEVALLTAKTQGVAAAAREVQPYLAGVPVVTVQNGVQSDELVAGVLGKENILSCVVLFGATFLEPGSVTYSPEACWCLAFPSVWSTRGQQRSRRCSTRRYPRVKRGEKTEIDYLNGEVVALGKTTGRPTPYNTAVVDLVHQVEATGNFLTAEQVTAAVNRAVGT